MNAIERWWELLAGAIFLAFLLLALLIAGALGWGGPPDDACWLERARDPHPCYCESIGERGEGMIRQPSNTWSALGFSVLGLVILGIRSRDRVRGTVSAHPNPMTTTSLFPVVLGLIVVYMGPGSMFFHASIRQWGGWLDSLSMVLWSDFLLFYSLMRMLRIDWRSAGGLALLVGGYAAVAVVMGVLIAILDEQATLLFGLLTVVAVIVLLVNQILLATRGQAGAASWAWLGGAAAVFTVALIVWTLAPCNATSALQSHAIWHLSAAIGVFLVYLYFRAGRDTP